MFEIYQFYLYDFVSAGAISSMCYLMGIFRLQEWRDKHKIVFDNGYRVWASWWFWFMGLYSIITTLAMTPIPLWILPGSSFCDVRLSPVHETWVMRLMIGFWGSKILEFGDTFFLILSNRRLILLQWFHHVVTLWYVLYSMFWFNRTGLMFAYINLVIHSFMYPYFSYSLHPNRPSLCHPQWITRGQIVQMVFGLSIICLNKIMCRPFHTDYFGFVMYGIYFVMFSEFFTTKYKQKL